jgi:diacylglycerol O-acyltransferase
VRDAGVPVDRASPADLAMRAIDTGGTVPMQFAAVLLLGPGATPDDALAGVVAERLGGVPRLRQRLVRVLPGAGRPVWVDDPHFSAGAHVQVLRCPPPGDEQALLDLAAELVGARLPADRPGWNATVVRGLPEGRTGVVVVLSHVLADGVGGLALLASVVDGAGPPEPQSPRPRASYPRLAAEAWAGRARSLTRWRSGLSAVRDALRAGGGLRAPRAALCSLLVPTGPHRRAHGRAGGARAAAAGGPPGGRHGQRRAARRGGRGPRGTPGGPWRDGRPLVVTVLVSGRRSATVTDLGNANTPLVVAVPVAGDPTERLRRFAGTVRGARAAATAPPLIALFGPVFRVLAALGGYSWYLAHQRRFHTLVSNVPGPGEPLSLAGRTVEAIMPVAAGEAGNVTVSFDALSYAGTLAVTVMADRDRVPDLPVLTAALRTQLASLVSPAPVG